MNYPENAKDLPKPVMKFSESPFPDWIKDVLKKKGFRGPTGIQALSWPAAILGHDVGGISETGSGKTYAYVLPMLHHILAQHEPKPGEGCIGLVLVPTRELCHQVSLNHGTYYPPAMAVAQDPPARKDHGPRHPSIC